MGFVRPNRGLEDYFDSIDAPWSMLRDREYAEIVSKWKELFLESSGRVTCKGNNAIKRLLERLGNKEAFLFNVPNVSHWHTSSINEGTFGYVVSGFRVADKGRSVLNDYNTIVCGKHCEYMCAFDHEAGVMSKEIYFEM